MICTFAGIAAALSAASGMPLFSIAILIVSCRTIPAPQSQFESLMKHVKEIWCSDKCSFKTVCA